MAVHLQAQHEVIALAGFHIKRQEFEPEYDNEAEMIVADMEFNDDDTEVSETRAVVGGRTQHVPCEIAANLCIKQCACCNQAMHETICRWAYTLLCCTRLLVSAFDNLYLLQTLHAASA